MSHHENFRNAALRRLITKLKILNKCRATLLYFSPCSTFQHSTFSTSERLTISLAHFYKKDERALPGNHHSSNLPLFPLLNVMSPTTPTHLSLSLTHSLIWSFGLKELKKNRFQSWEQELCLQVFYILGLVWRYLCDIFLRWLKQSRTEWYYFLSFSDIIRFLGRLMQEHLRQNACNLHPSKTTCL
jgi:hypothetical protein